MSSSLESTKPANNRALPRTAVQTHWKRPTRANRSASPSPLTRPNSQLVASMAQRSVYIYPSSSPPAPKKYIPDIVTPRGQRAKPHLSATQLFEFGTYHLEKQPRRCRLNLLSSLCQPCRRKETMFYAVYHRVNSNVRAGMQCSGLGVATSDGLPFVAAVTQPHNASSCVTNGEIWPFFIFNVAQSGEGGTLSISDQFHLKEDLSRLPLVIGLLSNWTIWTSGACIDEQRSDWIWPEIGNGGEEGCVGWMVRGVMNLRIRISVCVVGQSGHRWTGGVVMPSTRRDDPGGTHRKLGESCSHSSKRFARSGGVQAWETRERKTPPARGGTGGRASNAVSKFWPLANNFRNRMRMKRNHGARGRVQSNPASKADGEAGEENRTYFDGKAFTADSATSFGSSKETGLVSLIDLPKGITLDGEPFGGRRKFQDTRAVSIVKTITDSPLELYWNSKCKQKLMVMVRGRPRKRARNTAGLQNQAPSKSNLNSPETAPIPEDTPLAPPGHDGEELFDNSESEMSEQDMVEGPTIWGDLEDDDFGQRLAEFAVLNDPDDDEWIPVALRRRKVKKGHPSTYIKGPDVMSKSRRTQQRHMRSWKNQTNLCQFGFTRQVTKRRAPSVTESELDSRTPENSSSEEIQFLGASMATIEVGSGVDGSDMSETSAREGLEVDSDSDLDGLDVDDSDVTMADEELEAWEEESDMLAGICSSINQLMILANFATLRLKGLSWIRASEEIARQWHDGKGSWFARRVRSLARHYRTFEQLPKERRGGVGNARTWLADKGVETRVKDYLSTVPSGKVTPRALRDQVNLRIFPELGIKPKKPLHVRTARRWLIKLGWRHSMIRKGIYMDGHERADVVKYRREIFLPTMAAYEMRMVHYEGPDPMNRIEPVLQDDEKEIVPNFHDESAFHHHDASRSAWSRLQKDEQPLRKKGRGRLIHVSDFINPETGRLVLRDDNGSITRDARKIIYPGANGDEWWDCNQLLAQMKEAIEIFEAAHPGKQALFIFDQSSAHASLPPDALKAFEMNKSDGGKQRIQRDTIIPQSNPVAELRGRPQDYREFWRNGGSTYPVSAQNALLQQEDFVNQPSMLETLITSVGHKSMFLPKFHLLGMVQVSLP
ncbi:hypothetical protein F5887DRAFT_1161111 [Amanita rubescens]|nr:hypothetical protein F5887DRAFT_1161111 [Amanita rubescens]